jgi:Cu2+-exporting ATPase
MSAAAGLTPSQCAHCGLRLPSRPHRQTEGNKELLFCCAGCVLVFRIVRHDGEGARADWFLAKLGLATLLSGNVMLFQSLTYFNSLESAGADVVQAGSWIMFFCSLAVFALLGVPMLRIATGGLSRGQLTLEMLIGLGALAAIGYSAAQTLSGGHTLYYDSGTMVLVLITLGQYLDAESRRRALAALAPTLNRTRRQARLVQDGTEVCITPALVEAGEIVHVRAGEEIPVDGTVATGRADVHEPLMTGEWQPRLVAPGDSVSAGSLAVDGALTVIASGVAETLADRIERFALEARDRQAPVQRVADRVVTFFIPAVLLISAASLCGWGWAGDWARGLEAALAVLVVACPCAVGIAAPLATTIALFMAIRRGCLVRSGAVLETLSQVRAMAFDKTGTLTVGRPQVLEYRPCPRASLSTEETLRLAAGVEQEVSHPFARAIVSWVLARGQPVPQATLVRVTAGGGARGRVKGRLVEVGKLSWLATCGVNLPPATAIDTPCTVVGIAIDGQFAGELILDDPCRSEAPEAMRALAQMGLSCHMLSGDREDVVARVAKRIGCIDFTGDLSPIDKPLRVSALRASRQSVAMVGDGVNDALAFDVADVGIAFGPAADLAKETAAVTILREDLLEIPRLLQLARTTLRVVRQNLAWAFAYNVVAVVIAALGLLRPVFAAAAMVLSSLCVVGNSMRLERLVGASESVATRPLRSRVEEGYRWGVAEQRNRQ